jgi:hypothetical protein
MLGVVKKRYSVEILNFISNLLNVPMEHMDISLEIFVKVKNVQKLKKNSPNEKNVSFRFV